MELFKLFGSIFVNTDDAESSIQKTTNSAEGFASKLGNGIKTAAKWGAAIVAGATVAATAMVGFASSSAETADTIDKMSQKIGISRQAYQELDFICSQSGMSVDQLQAGMKSLTAAMDGAASGTKSNIEQFERLGVSVTNTDGSLRGQEEVLWETLEALQNVKNETEKARLATELFGKSGTELIPLLNSESGSIEEMKKQAHDLGLVLDDELINAGVKLTDSLDQTKRAFGSIATQLGGALMPIVTKASDYIQQAMPTIQVMVQEFAPVITSLLGGLLPPLMNLAEQIFPVLMEIIQMLIPPLTEIVSMILPVIAQLMEMLLPPILQIVEMILPLLMKLIGALLPILNPILALLEPLINLLVVLLEPLIQLLDAILPPLIALVADMVTALVDLLMPVITAVADLIGTVFNGAIQSIMPVMQLVMQELQNAWNNIKIFITTYAQSIFTKISAVFNSIKTTISTVMDTVSRISTTVWNKIVSTVGNAAGAIKNVVEGIFTKISAVFNSIKTTISTVMDTVSRISTTVWNKIVNTAGNAVSAIKNVVEGIRTTFTNVFGALVNIVKTPLNAMISAVNFIVDALNTLSFDVPDWVPGIGGKTFGFDLNNVAYLKDGGILTKPTYLGATAAGEGIVAGEAGAEAIIPLSKMEDFVKRDDSTIIELLTAILKVLHTLDESQAERFEAVLENMRFEIDKREFARLVKAV